LAFKRKHPLGAVFSVLTDFVVLLSMRKSKTTSRIQAVPDNPFGRRRHRSDHEKPAIVRESLQEGIVQPRLAREHGISPAQPAGQWKPRSTFRSEPSATPTPLMHRGTPKASVSVPPPPTRGHWPMPPGRSGLPSGWRCRIRAAPGADRRARQPEGRIVPRRAEEPPDRACRTGPRARPRTG